MSSGISNTEVTEDLGRVVPGPSEGKSLTGLILRENGGETLETAKRNNSSRV